jgi:hypothetical protein
MYKYQYLIRKQTNFLTNDDDPAAAAGCDHVVVDLIRTVAVVVVNMDREYVPVVIVQWGEKHSHHTDGR